jgi:hypothetical protein
MQRSSAVVCTASYFVQLCIHALRLDDWVGHAEIPRAALWRPLGFGLRSSQQRHRLPAAWRAPTAPRGSSDPPLHSALLLAWGQTARALQKGKLVCNTAATAGCTPSFWTGSRASSLMDGHARCMRRSWAAAPKQRSIGCLAFSFRAIVRIASLDWDGLRWLRMAQSASRGPGWKADGLWHAVSRHKGGLGAFESFTAVRPWEVPTKRHSIARVVVSGSGTQLEGIVKTQSQPSASPACHLQRGISMCLTRLQRWYPIDRVYGVMAYVTRNRQSRTVQAGSTKY